jgi:phenylpropionate dioxygenase-like ring-hydroxylating dioxygenase large terminal subunit
MSTVTGRPVIDYQRLVQDGALSQQLFTDPAIFDEELERIWYRGWVYLGHESEIPEPGDYVTRVAGQQPVIMSRDPEGVIHLLLNRCPHRGNTVCQFESGNSSAFRCAYHGWTFGSNGELIGATYASGYGPDFDKRDFAMARLPRVDSYRGFVFGSFASTGITLAEHLGRAAEYLDRFCDLSPSGQVRVDAGCVKTRYDANWKLLLDNAVDGYHPLFLHRAVLKSYRAEGADPAAAYADDGTVTMRDLGSGHALLDFRAQNRAGGITDVSKGGARQAREDHIAALAGRLGAERARELVVDGLSNIVIFPNLMLVLQDIRTVQPVGPHRSVVYNWPALLEGAPEAINQARLKQQNASYGPAGLITPDDMEIFERSQRAFATRTPERLLLSRGAWRDEPGDDGTLLGRATDETAHRGIWRHYREVMST